MLNEMVFIASDRDSSLKQNSAVNDIETFQSASNFYANIET